MTFIERLRAAAATDLEFWDRRRPPKKNVSRSSFLRLLKLLDENIEPRWSDRESKAGKHGLDGEEKVFSFTASITSMGKTRSVYVKGFFFTKENPVGVEIQSCRFDED